MTRTLLWLFFLADLAGIAWAVRVLVREARRHLAWHLGQWRERRAGTTQRLELPEGSTVVPAGGSVPRQRTPGSAAAPPLHPAAPPPT